VVINGISMEFDAAFAGLLDAAGAVVVFGQFALVVEPVGLDPLMAEAGVEQGALGLGFGGHGSFQGFNLFSE